MERIRRVGNSAILCELAKKGVKEGGDKEGEESMNIALETVVGKREETMRVTVSDWREWESVDCRVSELVIASICCNEEEVKEVDLGRFASLKVFEVGDECFEDVNEVKLIGLSKLERVVIGKNCFTKMKNDWGNDPNRHFYLKNCERLRELKMGLHSFSDYSVCEIENVDYLEVIEMGELGGERSTKESTCCFFHSNLELKSGSQRRK